MTMYRRPRPHVTSLFWRATWSQSRHKGTPTAFAFEPEHPPAPTLLVCPTPLAGQSLRRPLNPLPLVVARKRPLAAKAFVTSTILRSATEPLRCYSDYPRHIVAESYSGPREVRRSINLRSSFLPLLHCLSWCSLDYTPSSDRAPTLLSPPPSLNIHSLAVSST